MAAWPHITHITRGNMAQGDKVELVGMAGISIKAAVKRVYYTDTKPVRSLLFNLAITISTRTWICQQVHCPSSLAKSSFGWKSDCLYEKYCANKRFNFFFSSEYWWLLEIKLAVICKPLMWQSSGIQTMFMDLQQ